MTIKIFTGDCRDVLKSMPDESVHCVVTSPPYWGLRDYGIDGQLGMERNLGEYIETMVAVFREVHRVLRRDGTLWLNLGDSYAASVNGRSAADTKALGEDDRTFRDKPFSTIGPIYVSEGQVPDNKNLKARVGQSGNKNNGASDFGGRIKAGGIIKPKDLCGIPWRVAFALQEDGWYLRQDIIWSKPNPMPESVRDRCTKAHEYLFLLSKNERYYFDQAAIAESVSGGAHARRSYKMPDGWDTGPGGHGSFHRNGREKGRPPGVTPKSAAAGSGIKANESFHAAVCDLVDERNRRSVWEIPTAPFSEAHFATFPPALIEPCIKAGTSEKGCCAKCGAPWQREVEHQKESSERKPRGKALTLPRHDGGTWNENNGRGFMPVIVNQLGWRPSCTCSANGCIDLNGRWRVVPATVLDPFAGAGTTGLVADRLERNSILIELNPEYVKIAENRLRQDAGMFLDLQHA